MINKVHKFKTKDEWLQFRGRFLEDGVAKAFEYISEHTVVKASAENLIMQHPVYTFLKASPDRKVFMYSSHKHSDTAILEIKTTGMTIDPDDIPVSFFVQGMYYAGFWEYENIIVCWYDRHRNSIDWKEYRFDKDLFDMIIDKAVDFWNVYVIPDVPPPAQSESDIKLLYPDSVEDKIIIADNNVLTLYSEAIDIYRKKKVLTNKYSEISTKIKLIMKDAERLVDADLNILFTFKKGKRDRMLRIKEV